MTNTNGTREGPPNPFISPAALRSLRDSTLETWSKLAIDMVNTDLFAQWLGIYLSSTLAATAPFQQQLSQYTDALLPRLNLPSRAEVTSVARRLTTIEMRLDDIDAQVAELLRVAQAPPATPTAIDQRLQAIEQRLDALLAAVQPAPAPKPARARRTPRSKPAKEPS
jgi:tetrahydromethanopterin S-methyltransferase subunit G